MQTIQCLQHQHELGKTHLVDPSTQHCPPNERYHRPESVVGGGVCLSSCEVAPHQAQARAEFIQVGTVIWLYCQFNFRSRPTDEIQGSAALPSIRVINVRVRSLGNNG